MATYDLTTGLSAVKNLKGADRSYRIENTVDFSTVNAGAGVASGDVVKCLPIAAGTKVIDVMVQVITPTGLTSTATVGDSGTANNWNGSVNLNAAANTIVASTGGTDAAATARKLYTAADNIQLTCTITGGPATVGKMRVYALCIDCN